MDKESIIRMARECKLHIGGPPVMPELERFAAAAYAAGATDERKRLREEIHSCHANCDHPVCVAVRKEREAIIQIMPGGSCVDPQWVCDAIRARGQE